MKKYNIASAAALMALLALSGCGETETADTSAEMTTVITESEDTAEPNGSPAAVPEAEAAVRPYTAADDVTVHPEAEEPEEDAVYTDNMSAYTYIVPRDGSYSFTHGGGENLPWNIYVRDEEFPDGLRYLYSNFSPDYVSDCTAELKEGQYVYLICTENEWTGGEQGDTELTVSYKGNNNETVAAESGIEDEEPVPEETTESISENTAEE